MHTKTRSRERIPTPGELRVWFIANVPGEPTWIPVDTVERAIRIINELADAQLNMPWITDNAFGLSVWEDGEWCDWYSEDGEDLREYEKRIAPLTRRRNEILRPCS